MKLTAAVIDAMLAAGASADVFAAAFKAAAVEEELRLADKRAANAERQRRFKAKRKAEREGNEANALPRVTTPLDGPPDENKSNPPLNPPELEDEEEDARAVEREVHASIVAEWNAMAKRTGLRRASKLTDERRGRIRARLAEHGRDAFTEAIARIETSPWCNGDNDRGWTADFDFLLQPSSFLKVIEGKYDRQQPSPARHQHPSPSRGGGFAHLGSALDAAGMG